MQFSRLFPDSRKGLGVLNTQERRWGRGLVGALGEGGRSPGFPEAKRLLVSCAGRNEPLKKERLKWKSDYPMTDGQLRSKRDEFWDTAPAFEGRKEIWDALKAAAYAAEANDHELAQAILDGASITLPHGEQRGRASPGTPGLNVSRCCGNSKSLTHCAGPRLQPTVT